MKINVGTSMAKEWNIQLVSSFDFKNPILNMLI